MQSRLLIICFILILALCSCVQLNSRDPKLASHACAVGKVCAMHGKLRLYPAQSPAWVAILESGSKCFKLALPDDFYTEAKNWNRKKVTVTGSIFEQPRFDESQGIATLWYTEQDRKIALGVCDGGDGIYVESMQSTNGVSWGSK